MTVTLDTRNLNRLLSELPNLTQSQINAVAFKIEAHAKMRVPVNTGELRASIKTQTPTTNHDLPNAQLGEAYVGPVVEYGLYQEFGTRKMPAQPFMLPAVHLVEGELQELLRREIERYD